MRLGSDHSSSAGRASSPSAAWCVAGGGWRAFVKRAIDVTVATSGLVVTAPISLLAMLAVRLQSEGGVICSQWRVGKDGRLFRMFKLRSMTADAETRKADLMGHNEADGPLFKIAAILASRA
jgi:lipopolysaccharide/colanic/teichoic acid biosynthesis glycosyltransferase